jgi:hypothetical protein
MLDLLVKMSLSNLSIYKKNSFFALSFWCFKNPNKIINPPFRKGI